MVCIYTIFISIFSTVYIYTSIPFEDSLFFSRNFFSDEWRWYICDAVMLHTSISHHHYRVWWCEPYLRACFFYVYDVESRDGNHLQKTITSSCVLARAWEDDDNDDDDEDDAPSSLEIYLLLLCAALRFQLYFLEIIFTRIISTDYTCIDLFFFFFIFFFRSSLSSFFLSLSSYISNIDV